MYTIEKTISIDEIDPNKLYAPKEIAEMFNKTQANVSYLMKQWYFNGYTEVVWGTPRYKRTNVWGKGIIKFIQDTFN